MNKQKYVVVIVIICLLVGVSFMLLHDRSNSKIENFLLIDYQNYLDEFSSDLVLGETPDAESAKKKAEDVWVEKYGESIKHEKTPYMVFFDENSDVWMVTGSLPRNMDGGVPYMLIQKSDGKVLAVWHDK